jgi:hypothetical protein
MKIDHGIHIVMHLVSFGKTSVIISSSHPTCLPLSSLAPPPKASEQAVDMLA